MGNKITAKDTRAEVVNKRNVLSASVASYIKKAEVMVGKTSAGKFL